MSLREKLHDGVQPFLDPGERVVTAFPAQTGPNPLWVGAFGVLLHLFGTRFRLVVVTDRNILLLRSGLLSAARPRELERRVPREPLAFDGKAWGKVVVDGERHWVHRRFRKDVAAAG
jgi:hypothetical protein